MEKLSELLTLSPDIIGDLLDAKDLLLIDQIMTINIGNNKG